MDTGRAIRTLGARLAGNLAVGVLLSFSALAASSAASREAAQQGDGLRIVVIEGEDSVNIIGQGTAVPGGGI